MLKCSTVPGLLVSVRDAPEALAALAGEADVIDVKEPRRGSLGAADPSTIAAVVNAVGNKALVTAAMGELRDWAPERDQAERTIPRGVQLFKMGLAGCGDNARWPDRWRAAIESVTRGDVTQEARPVAVVYADWRKARAPHPEDVLKASLEVGCPALLVDTYDKSRGGLFDHWPISKLAQFIETVQAHDIAVVLAGSLTAESIITALQLAPDLVAVRTAACDGGRNGAVAAHRVKALRQKISAKSRVSVGSSRKA